MALPSRSHFSFQSLRSGLVIGALLLIVCLPGHLVSAGAAVLKGGDLTCRLPDGHEVQVPGITNLNQWTVTCVCQKGVVSCHADRDPCAVKLDGCPRIVPVRNSRPGANPRCSTECMGCHTSDQDYLPSGSMQVSGDRLQQCFAGLLTVIRITSLTNCPPAPCSKPLIANFSAGRPCPSCPGCALPGGEVLPEGQATVDPSDSCNVCACTKNRISCYRPSCPPLPCSSGNVKQVHGRCCPICVGPEPEPPHQGNVCLFRDQIFHAGQVFRPDRRTTCQCLASLTIECVVGQQSTKELSLFAGAAAVRPPIIEASSPMQLRGCMRTNGTNRMVEDGASWREGCLMCSCKSGEIICRRRDCAAECTKMSLSWSGDKPSSEADRCCPACRPQEGACTVFGDPHYKTFDGRIFNFQGSCKYLLARHCPDSGPSAGANSSSAFSVRITNDARDSLAFSWTRTVTVRLPGIKVSLLQRMRVKIDGKRVSLPYIKLGALSVMKDGYRVVLRTNEGVKLLWDGVSFLELTVPPKFRNRLCGLCGNFNGDPSDDFHGRRGRDFQDGQHFGDSWRVGGLKACSILPRDMPQSYEPHCTQSWESRITSERYCNALNSTLFDKCHEKVDPDYYFNACKLDMCECPGDQCHCEVLTAYARECERAGLLVHNWREATGCRNVTSFQYKFHKSSNHSQQMAEHANDVLLPPKPQPRHQQRDWWLSMNKVGSKLHQSDQPCDHRKGRRCQSRSNSPKLATAGGEEKTGKDELPSSKTKKQKHKKKKKKNLSNHREQEARMQRRRERRRKRKLQEKRKNRPGHDDARPDPRDSDAMAGLVIQQVKDDDGNLVRRRLSWAGLAGSSKMSPPFESLLASSSADSHSQAANNRTDDGDEEDNDEGDKAELVGRKLGTTASYQHSRPGLRAGTSSDHSRRTPLPLMDGAVLSRPAVADEPEISTQYSSINQRQDSIQNWKSRRRKKRQPSNSRTATALHEMLQ